MPKQALLIHGPIEGHTYRETLEHVHRWIAAEGPQLSKIVVSAYARELDEVQGFFRECAVPVEFVSNQDVAIPGFYNINRQVNLVSHGLKGIDAETFVIKLRSDQYVDLRRLARVLRKLDYFAAAEDKLLTTNCYTRSDRLYHPSDMFLCGYQPALSQYYSLPYQRSTHMDRVLDVCREHALHGLSSLPNGPEELLFRNYLKTQGWDFLETAEDSLAAIRRYCHVANSWDIGLRWSEKRTPYWSEKSVVLPYWFESVPFEGGPIEQAYCLSRHEIDGSFPSLRDVCYLALSKGLWRWFLGQQRAKGYAKRRLRSLRKSIAKRLPLRRAA